LRLYFLIILLSLTSLLAAQVPDTVKYRSLEPYDFHLGFLKEDNAILIDVREFFEYRRSRLKDAVNIPSSGNLQFASDTISKEFSLFFYCSTGFRSKRVAKTFYDYGFRKLYNLEGGIVAWRKAGMPEERKRMRRKS
jgi:rhodanese-related sulfurtransferase